MFRSRCLLILIPMVTFFPRLLAECSIEFGPATQTGALESTDITEASGLAASWRNPGVLWTHNDGSRDAVYALGTNGKHLGRYRLNKSVDDVEDIAVGPGPDANASYIYVGDIGSNNGSRNEVKILRVAEPAVSTDQSPVKTDFAGVESITLKYPSGDHDAEALLVDPVARELFVVTKGAKTARVFRTSIDGWDGNKRTLDDAGEIPFAQVSGGDISRDGRFVALRREDMAEYWIRAEGENVAQTLQRASRPLPVVGPPAEPNGESIAFLADLSGYMTVSEGAGEELYFFPKIESTDARFAAEPVVQAGGVSFQISGCAGTEIVLERSTDLQAWHEVSHLRLTTSSEVMLDSAPPAERAFYRLHY